MGVPTITEVQPGSSVSIVLKADQPTGREVQGQVQHILTRGNHPRGIKVRLRDGRIGRVQRMIAGVTATENIRSAHEFSSNGFTNVENKDSRSTSSHLPERSYRAAGYTSRYSDVRFDESSSEPAEQTDLMAYVKPAKQQRRRKHPQMETATSETAEILCPVCEDFQGDEVAVAHHVESHFNGGRLA